MSHEFYHERVREGANQYWERREAERYATFYHGEIPPVLVMIPQPPIPFKTRQEKIKEEEDEYKASTEWKAWVEQFKIRHKL